MDTNQLPSQLRVRSVNFERPLIVSAVSFVALAVFHLAFCKWLALGALAIGIRRFIRARRQGVTPVTAAPQDNEITDRQQVLKRAFSKAQFEDLTEKPAAQALEQLQQNHERMASFERTLSLKLNPSEITYARYHDAGEQVSRAVLDQLNDIATWLANVNSIKSTDETNPEEQRRKELREKELQKISDALAQNESALTRMDELTQAISEMKSLSTSAQDLGPLLVELEELAQRAKKY